MTIEHIDPTVERQCRKALGHAARAELAELDRLEEHLSDEQLAACIGLCAFTTAYTTIDVADRQWPNDATIRRIAEHTANTGEVVKRTGLTAEDAYTFISRVALGFEPLEKAFPDPAKISRLPFIVASSILAAYGPREMEWWQFLDVIEDAMERAWAIDLNVLPALMLRSRMLARSGAGPEAIAKQ